MRRIRRDRSGGFYPTPSSSRRRAAAPKTPTPDSDMRPSSVAALHRRTGSGGGRSGGFAAAAAIDSGGGGDDLEEAMSRSLLESSRPTLPSPATLSGTRKNTASVVAASIASKRGGGGGGGPPPPLSLPPASGGGGVGGGASGGSSPTRNANPASGVGGGGGQRQQEHTFQPRSISHTPDHIKNRKKARRALMMVSALAAVATVMFLSLNGHRSRRRASRGGMSARRHGSKDAASASSSSSVRTSDFDLQVPAALSSLAELSTPYDRESDVPYYWDVHFSGESVAERVLAKCHGLAQACEHGLSQPNFNEEKLEIFLTNTGHRYVNVDTTTSAGIVRAKKLGLAASRVADVTVSPLLHEFASSVFTPTNRGRMFALFRHPVDRAVSMYYYLASASWDPMYDPGLKDMTLAEYASSGSIEHNWVTRFLLNKPGGKLSKEDMLTAKEILRKKCLVGLYDEIENSLARFDRYFGWTPRGGKQKRETASCRKAFVIAGDKRHEHPSVEKGGTVYEAILDSNRFDVELYEYARVLYRVQGEQIFGIV